MERKHLEEAYGFYLGKESQPKHLSFHTTLASKVELTGRDKAAADLPFQQGKDICLLWGQTSGS